MQYLDFHSDENSSHGLLGYNIVLCSGMIPVFWRVILPLRVNGDSVVLWNTGNRLHQHILSTQKTTTWVIRFCLVCHLIVLHHLKYFCNDPKLKGQGSSVSVVTRLQARWPGLIPSMGRDFFHCYHVCTGCGVHPASSPVGTGVFSSGVKLLGHGAICLLLQHLHSMVFKHRIFSWCGTWLSIGTTLPFTLQQAELHFTP
jgi:hypothetical protein